MKILLGYVLNEDSLTHGEGFLFEYLMLYKKVSFFFSLHQLPYHNMLLFQIYRKEAMKPNFHFATHTVLLHRFRTMAQSTDSGHLLESGLTRF